MRHARFCIPVFALAMLVLSSCSSKPVNAVMHPSFDEDGCLIDPVENFKSCQPAKIRLYVEASGSMKGFLRSNRATAFKQDVWSVFSDLGSFVDDVCVFEQSGKAAGKLSLTQFRDRMNAGDFFSSFSTEVPEMIEAMIGSLDVSQGEIAVLVSDMKYSPVGSSAMDVKLSQYAADIRNLLRKHPDLSLSLVAATSDFLNAGGKVACTCSPYYYLIIGKSECVVWVRNSVAQQLRTTGRFVDATDFGIDYKSPNFHIKNVSNGFLMDGQPTITNLDTDYSPTCRFDIVMDVEGYPFSEERDDCGATIDMKCVWGSTVAIDTIVYSVSPSGKQAVMTVEVSDIFGDADVVEFTLSECKKSSAGGLAAFFGAESENELDRTFSLESFIQGCRNARHNSFSKEPCRILISKIKQ